nr:cytochrome P450 [Myxococcota bacterium]
ALRSPGTRERLLSEVRDTRGGRESDEVRDVEKMPFLAACVDETLRLTPPTLISLRWLARETTVAGHALAAGTIVAPCAYLAHRSASTYPDPHTFRPERFIGGDPGPNRYFPFGGGIRHCLGAGFSAYEMKVVLAAVLERFEVELVNGRAAISRRRGIVVAPSCGVPVVVRLRGTKRPPGATVAALRGGDS